MSASLHKTLCGGLYHIHGSLDATINMRMLGMDPFRTDVTGYAETVALYRETVGQFTVTELECLTRDNRQAGAPVLSWKQFCSSKHGKAMLELEPFTAVQTESLTPAVPIRRQEGSSARDKQREVRALEGVKVLELCRIIAGPTIGRCLAAHGASVIKVTSSKLPDIAFFQIDVNTGKHCIDLDLRSTEDLASFKDLLEDADVLIDGYRPGALARLGINTTLLDSIAQRRQRGFVHVLEDCFGGSDVDPSTGQVAEWAYRAGWQQIADCVTGVAAAQGQFMGLANEEPIVPPLPMSDYGTGTLGAVAALVGLYRRAKMGGSWRCRTSLVQYDVFLQRLGRYPASIQALLRTTHDDEFFGLRHWDTVDEVGSRAEKSVRRLHPHLFGHQTMQKAWSRGYGAEIAWAREAVKVDGVLVGHVRATRPNGSDEGGWEGWEVDEDMEDGKS